MVAHAFKHTCVKHIPRFPAFVYHSDTVALLGLAHRLLCHLTRRLDVDSGILLIQVRDLLDVDDTIAKLRPASRPLSLLTYVTKSRQCGPEIEMVRAAVHAMAD
jgi:hypothetical protein